jgi:hypothetical protein
VVSRTPYSALEWETDCAVDSWLASRLGGKKGSKQTNADALLALVLSYPSLWSVTGTVLDLGSIGYAIMTWAIGKYDVSTSPSSGPLSLSLWYLNSVRPC